MTAEFLEGTSSKRRVALEITADQHLHENVSFPNEPKSSICINKYPCDFFKGEIDD